MADSGLRDWVKVQQLNGYSIEQIKQYLYQNGYSAEMVEEATAPPKKSFPWFILIIAFALILIGGIFFFFDNNKTTQEERVVVNEPIQAKAITPDELKSEILKGYINIRNYKSTNNIMITDFNGNIIFQSEITERVETKEKKILLKENNNEQYIIENKIFIESDDGWTKEGTNKEYFELKNIINLIQDSTIIILEDDGSSIMLLSETANNYTISLLNHSLNENITKIINQYDNVVESRIECNVDSDKKITSIKAYIKLSDSLEDIEANIEVDFTGYNIQSEIFIPFEESEIKNKTTSLPQEVIENISDEHQENITEDLVIEENNSSVQKEEFTSNYTYVKYKSFDPMNPVTVVEKYISSVINLNVDDYKSIMNSEMLNTMKDFPDSMFEQHLTQQKPKYIQGFSLSHCLDYSDKEIDCENYGEETRIKFYVKTNVTELIELELEETGWKIQ